MKKLTTLFLIIAFSAGVGFAQKTGKQPKKQEVAQFRLDEDICPTCKRKIDNNIAFEKGVTDIVYGEDGSTVKVTFRTDRTDTLKLRKAFEKVKLNVIELKMTDEKGK